MNRTLTALAALSLVSLSAAATAQTATLEAQADAALKADTHAWDFVEGITTEVEEQRGLVHSRRREFVAMLRDPWFLAVLAGATATVLYAIYG